MARPSEFSTSTANALCEHLIEGKSLRSFCDVDGNPSASTVCRWLAQNEEFRKQYAHAREAQADTLADEILFISDNETDANLGRLKIDARKWLAGKMRPKVYGEKSTTEHTGEGGGPVALTVKFV